MDLRSLFGVRGPAIDSQCDFDSIAHAIGFNELRAKLVAEIAAQSCKAVPHRLA